MMLKMGERGMITYRALPTEEEDVRSFFVLDTFADHVLDAVGSGDALLAYATLSMVTNGNPVIGSILGSMAAAVECEIDGNEPVTPKDVLAKINRYEHLANFGEA